MTTPTADQIANAQANFLNLYQLVDGVITDFGVGIMPNISNILTQDQEDPGQGLAGEILSGFFGSLWALSGFLPEDVSPGFGAVTGICSYLYADLLQSNPTDLQGQLASYQVRVYQNLKDFQNLISNYSNADTLTQDWDQQFVDPDNNTYGVSYFGTAGIIPSEQGNLTGFNALRQAYDYALAQATWQYFLNKDYQIGDWGGVSFKSLPWAVCQNNTSQSSDQVTAMFNAWMDKNPGDYLQLLDGSKQKCVSGTVYSYYYFSLGRQGTPWTTASSKVASYLLTTTDYSPMPTGLVDRQTFFTGWGMTHVYPNVIPDPGADPCTYPWGSSAALGTPTALPATLAGGSTSGRSAAGRVLAKQNLDGAELRHSNLFAADFREASLCRVDLTGATLNFARFDNARLDGADLTGAKAEGISAGSASLVGTTLCDADLACADLRGANLSSANLRGAQLVAADLRNADLRDADLSNAALRGADLTGARLDGARFDGADLSFAAGAPNLPSVVMRSKLAADAATLFSTEDVAALARRHAAACGRTLGFHAATAFALFDKPVGGEPAFLVPLTNEGALEMVVRGTGSGLHRQIVGVLEAMGCDASVIDSFKARSVATGYDRIGLRVGLSDDAPTVQPFIDRGIGLGQLRAEMSADSATLRTIGELADVLGVNHVYMWGTESGPKGKAEGAVFRVRGLDDRVLQRIAEMTTTAFDNNSVVARAIRRAPLPVLVSVAIGTDGLRSTVSYAVPTASVARFRFGDLLDDAAQTRLALVTTTDAHHIWFTQGPNGTERVHVYL